MHEQRYLDCARKIADWYCRNVIADFDNDAKNGSFSYYIDKDGTHYAAGEWIISFSAMALFSAAKVFQDERYFRTAESMMSYTSSLQIFDPFHNEHYGAIREIHSQSHWCYVRDALSAAWGYLEYYRISGNAEFLERARLWGEWFLKHGLDETGWPIWGVVFDPEKQSSSPEMLLDMQGCFQGGCLNFFFHLYLETGDRKWVGPFFEHIADYFCTHLQQQDGFFRTISRKTGRVPEADPQNGLHRSNDDLGTLGLLCAWQIYHKDIYVKAIQRFIAAVRERQQPDGLFEASCAGVPVVFNTILEAGDLLGNCPLPNEEAALAGLLSRQYPESADAQHAGGLDELNDKSICARSMAYSIIYLLKRFGNDRRFLGVMNDR